MSHAMRLHDANSTDYLSALIETINDKRLEKVTFFVTKESLNLITLVEFSKPFFVRYSQFVFDGHALSAIKDNRAKEVSTVLTAAIATGKAFYFSGLIERTENLSEVDAGLALKEYGPIIKLEEETRAYLFWLLSTIPENSF